MPHPKHRGWPTSSASPWSSWVDTWATSNCTSALSSGAASWTAWNLCHKTLVNYATSSTTAATYDTAWVQWNQYGVGNRIHRGTVDVVQARNAGAGQARIREADARWRQAQRELENANALAAAVRAEAKEKAFKLLDSVLSPPQKEELKTKGFFTCKSKIGNTYRIYRGSHGNVKKVVGNKEVESLCVQPAYVPEGDCMLAQKFHIENDEEGFRQTANISRLN